MFVIRKIGEGTGCGLRIEINVQQKLRHTSDILDRNY